MTADGDEVEVEYEAEDEAEDEDEDKDEVMLWVPGLASQDGEQL